MKNIISDKMGLGDFNNVPCVNYEFHFQDQVTPSLSQSCLVRTQTSSASPLRQNSGVRTVYSGVLSSIVCLN